MRRLSSKSVFYNPDNVPANINDLPMFVQSELDKIQKAIEIVASGHVDMTYTPPLRAREGDFRLADGERWNPGQGRGFYGYYNGVWNLFTATSGGVELFWINVRDYGALGDGIADDGAKIQDAIDFAAATGGVVVFPSGIYLIEAKLVLKTGVSLFIYGATLRLKNGANDTVIEIESGASNVGVYGGTIDGNKGNNPTGINGICNAYFTQCSYVNIRDVKVTDCNESGIIIYGFDLATPSKYINVSGCTSGDNVLAGITCTFIEEFTFHGNTAYSNGTHGIGIQGSARYGTITGNTAADSVLADNFTGYGVDVKDITVSGNTSIRGANNGIHFGGDNIVMSNNTVFDPTMHGIAAVRASSMVSNNVTITGNIVQSPGKSGIWLDKCENFSIVGNSVADCTEHGIWLAENDDHGSVTGNNIRNCTLFGISLANDDYLTVSGNSIEGCGSTAIRVTDSTNNVFTGNNCKNNAAPLVEGGTSDYNLVNGNHVRVNTSTTITLVGANSVQSNNL